MGQGWRIGAIERFELREQVLLRDGPWCHWCGRITSEARVRGNEDPNSMTLDHLLRRRDGGSDDICNLVISCWGCNHGRN
jgi:5-methylcytosine-specific restriction endonuclease McrA